MQPLDQRTHALEACYDAIVAPEMWPDALHRFARTLDAVGCTIFPHGAQEERLTLPASPDYRAFLKEFIGGGWSRSDHRARRAWPRARGRTAFIEHDIASDEERRRLPQYHELYAKFDVPWWAAFCIRVDGAHWAVPFLRSASQGPFTRAEAATLLSYAPQFERLIRMAKHMAVSTATATLDALSQVNCPAMLIDWRGRVIASNAKADHLLGSGLSLSAGRILAADPAAQVPIDRLVAGAARMRDANAFAALAPVVVRRKDRAALLLDALPVSGLRADVFLHACALITITEIGGTTSPSVTRLRTALGLTESEARIAKLIGTGRSPAEAATALGITLETCRTNLKRIFDKAGVSRQSQLALIVSRVGRPWQ